MPPQWFLFRMAAPPQRVAVGYPGVPAGYVLVRCRIYEVVETGVKYDMKLLGLDGQRIWGTVAGTESQLQVNLGAAGRFYLHRLMAWERYREVWLLSLSLSLTLSFVVCSSLSPLGPSFCFSAALYCPVVAAASLRLLCSCPATGLASERVLALAPAQ